MHASVKGSARDRQTARESERETKEDWNNRETGPETRGLKLQPVDRE